MPGPGTSTRTGESPSAAILVGMKPREPVGHQNLPRANAKGARCPQLCREVCWGHGGSGGQVLGVAR